MLLPRKSLADLLSNSPVPHLDETIRSFGHYGIVSYHHDRGTLLFCHAMHQLNYFEARLSIEISGRLVGKNNPWMISECSRDSDPLLFTPAQLVRKMISPVLKPHPAQQFHRPIPGYSSFDSRRYEWKLNVLQRG